MSFYTNLSGLNLVSNSTDLSVGRHGVQRPSYARSYLERQGQVNWRAPTSSDETITEPSCVVFVSKRKGFGTTDNKESGPMSAHGIKLLNTSFPPDKFQRYIVKVYLKETGVSAHRRMTRSW